jgi:hypothetical protein
MEIFPKYHLRLRYAGEDRVYNLLRGIPVDDGFAVHSVNLPEHEYKRWGEADFVAVTPRGVTLLEVKGGQVSLVGRQWRYQNARGQAIISTEGPARQALSAAISLEKLLSDRLGRKVRCRWGVVFPLCHFSRELAELPPTRLADNIRCQNSEDFQNWLASIPSDQHDPSEFSLPPSDIDAIREIIVPELSAATRLGLAVRANESEIIRLTTQQFEILNAVVANPRITISGGAGTGKTELACLTARVEKTAGRNPVIVTSQNPLLLELKKRMSVFGIPVVSSTLPDGTDTLIVDEGQDYAKPDNLSSLFAQLPGGIRGGRWRWFIDPNLQYLENPPDPGSVAQLREHSMSVSLSRNVRSTREIVGAIRSILDADVGISEIDGFGIKVAYSLVKGHNTEQDAAEAAIVAALEEGVAPADIAILGAIGITGPVCAALLKKFPGQLRSLSSLGRIQSSAHGVVTSINSFRGLEARIVLLVDLDWLPVDRLGESLLYTGMSRASAALTMIVTSRFQERLKQLVARSLTT